MKKNLFILLGLTCAITACASSVVNNNDSDATVTATSSSPTGPGDRVTCTQGGDTRIVEIKKTAVGGCELLYTKFGSEKSVATSAGNKYCAEVREKIKTNLTQSGFKCE